VVQEGQGRVLQRANDVFYNKAQVVNRDLSLAVLRQFIRVRAAEHETGKAPKNKRAKAGPHATPHRSPPEAFTPVASVCPCLCLNHSCHRNVYLDGAQVELESELDRERWRQAREAGRGMRRVCTGEEGKGAEAMGSSWSEGPARRG